MKAQFLISCALLVLVLESTVHAQTDTTFTYQGELKQSGQPANGNFNLTFSLWDSLQNGSQVLGDLQINAVPVSEGAFTVNLDFGAHAFDNANRWLEIEVNGQTLAPRQFISRSPYSIQTRGIFVASDGKVGLGTTSPVADLEVDGTASPDTGLMVRAPGGATGQVAVSSPGGETGIIGIANGGNRRDIRFTDDGISLLTNSAPTIPSSINGLRILEDGSVLVGPSLSEPFTKMGVTSELPGTVALKAETLASGSIAVQGVVNGADSGISSAGYFHNFSSQGTGVFAYGERYSGYFSGGPSYFQQNVGIGVFDPEYKLDIIGDVRIDGLPTGTSTPIHISANNRLVRSTSSRRYKENIEALDLSEASEAFLQLQPVSYNYIGSSDPDIGLIAEDVAELVPELVTFDTEGRPEAVKYDKGALYLLEIVRQQRAELAEKDAVIERILQRLERLEQSIFQETRIADAPEISISRTVAGGARDMP